MGEFSALPYVHPLTWDGEPLPAQFTYPFRYTPHPLVRKAAHVVQQRLQEMGVGEEEGKMYGVLVVTTANAQGSLPSRGDVEGSALFFLAAYSGQLAGSYDHPWFVPPIVDYLAPDSHFQREQAAIMDITRHIQQLRDSEERRTWQQQVAQLRQEREAAVAEAKRVYAESKERDPSLTDSYIRLRQFQKAEIHRAKQLHKAAIADLEARLTDHNARIHALCEERRLRSEALQQWLFDQFRFLNARGEEKDLREIFKDPPSGAGECCAPKLLQTAYLLGLQPLAMGEFWFGPSQPGHWREPGAFFPACRSKCHPILGHMLQGLDVEPDPALHYDNKVLAPVRVIWEDESLAVVMKPEGWCSIPGKSDQPNLLDEVHRIWPAITGSVIVHRLDQDTSGLMVIAKTPRIHRLLCQQFERREVQKRYVALLEGRADPSLTQDLSLPLAPDLENMPRQQVDFERGKEAVTRYEILAHEIRRVCRCATATASSSPTTTELPPETEIPVTRVAFYPQTGRTHQLRVHAASSLGLGRPILGDRLYGTPSDRLYLHAESLTFTHPLTGIPLTFTEPAPF